MFFFSFFFLDFSLCFAQHCKTTKSEKKIYNKVNKFIKALKKRGHAIRSDKALNIFLWHAFACPCFILNYDMFYRLRDVTVLGVMQCCANIFVLFFVGNTDWERKHLFCFCANTHTHTHKKKKCKKKRKQKRYKKERVK